MGSTWGSRERPAVVAILTPVYETPELEFVRCHRELIVPVSDGRTGLWGQAILSDVKAMVIDDARNALVGAALRRTTPAVTHVLFVDADMTFPEDALARLLAHDVPIVGGLYFNRRPPYAPMLLRQNHESWADSEPMFGHVYDYPAPQLVEVDATGCGFLLVERQVFEKVRDPDGLVGGWFERYRGVSEDFSFCVRAQDAGFKILVDTGLKLGHIGKVVVDEAFAERNRQVRARAWHPTPKG